MASIGDRFRELHREGLFVMPNPWDIGTAKLLEKRGFAALATTSWGLAARLGRADYQVSRAELVAHTAEIAGAVGVPINVDSEACFPLDEGGISQTVHLLAKAGAAGCSIEDYDSQARRVVPIDAATEAVAIAAAAARETGLVLTARAENHLHAAGDLDDTIGRLRSYIEAGAEVAYAPGLTERDDIARLVAEVRAPINILARPNGPSIRDLADLGVRRVSTGGALTRVALAAIEQAIEDLLAGSDTRLPA